MQKWLILLLLVSCASEFSSLRKAELLKGKERNQYEAYAEKMMISTQGEYASLAGKEIYEKGGNIFDIATAVSFVIGVERPQSTGIGGGGFMLTYNAKADEVEAYDFREMAPRMANSKMFLDKNGEQIKDKSITGPLAVGTPGLVKGVLEVHKKYGKLPLDIVLAPAIRLARNGFKIYPALAQAIKEEAPRLKKFPSSAKIYLHPDGSALKEGELLVQKDLAHTMKLIAKYGADGFYKGEVADKIVATMKEYNGLISYKDLANYVVKKRRPIVGTYKGQKIVSMPPPSSGGVHIIQILNILENDDLKKHGAQSAYAIHKTSTAMQMAFSDRAQYLGDTDFKDVPVEELISKKYAKSLYALIPENKNIPADYFPKSFKEIYESNDTTHFTIMDGQGNIVTSTQTINGWFGSALVAEGTGIVLNNEMDDFASNVGGVNLFGAIGGKNNLVEPRKRPLSSMSPTIVFDKENKPLMALGTPSGTRILTCVMQTILNVLEYEMPLWEAVAATRYHQQWMPDEIRIGQPYFSPEVEKELKAMGHKLSHKSLGCKIQAIKKEGKLLHGVSDPREEGMSQGI